MPAQGCNRADKAFFKPSEESTGLAHMHSVLACPEKKTPKRLLLFLPRYVNSDINTIV